MAGQNSGWFGEHGDQGTLRSGEREWFQEPDPALLVNDGVDGLYHDTKGNGGRRVVQACACGLQDDGQRISRSETERGPC